MTTSAPPRPPRSCIDILAIPAPLRRRDQWAAFRYGFRDGSWTKIPKQPNGKNARSNDPKTWSPFKVAWAAFEADPTLDGIGYFFSEDDPYCFIDIDKVKSSPERLAWALGIVERFGTYAEWSVSDNGLHLIGEGRMPDADGTPQKGRNDQKKGLEAYSRRRFATFTGKAVEDATTAVVECQAALDWLLANEFKPKDPGKPAVRIDRPAGLIASTDRIERIKEKMFSGPRGAQLRRSLARPRRELLEVVAVGAQRPELTAAEIERRPAEESAVETLCSRWIPGVEDVEVQRPRLVHDPRALVLPRLPDAERCPFQVGEHRHPAGVHHLQRLA